MATAGGVQVFFPCCALSYPSAFQPLNDAATRAVSSPRGKGGGACLLRYHARDLLALARLSAY